MKQSSLGLNNNLKRTRRREFLDAMELVVPWAELIALIEPYAPESGHRGQQPFAVHTLPRIHFKLPTKRQHGGPPPRFELAGVESRKARCARPPKHRRPPG